MKSVEKKKERRWSLYGVIHLYVLHFIGDTVTRYHILLFDRTGKRPMKREMVKNREDN